MKSKFEGGRLLKWAIQKEFGDDDDVCHWHAHMVPTAREGAASALEC